MATVDLIAIGERIKRRRIELGYTQQAIYEKLDVSQNHYSRIENGRVGMSFEILLQLCEILNLTADYILTGKAQLTDSCTFIDVYNRLSPKQKSYIEKHILLFSECELK